MEFGILGPLQVVDGERVVDLGSRKQRCTLALLVLHANRIVSLDRIVDALWPGEVPPGHLATLHSYVSRLRGVLEPSRAAGTAPMVLVRDAPGYRLVVEDGELDARVFERLVADGDKALLTGDLFRADRLFDQALALWRGDVLGDLGEADFARGEATRLEQLRLHATEQRFDAALRLGRHGTVVVEGTRVLAVHPYRERLRGQVMLGLYRSGQQVDALRVYREGRAMLVEELGVEPAPALQQLEESILQQKSELDWKPPPPRVDQVGAAGPVRLPPILSASAGSFVGREAEVAELRDAWRRAVEGAREIHLLSGEPGIGKTRLAAELAVHAAHDGAIVLYGRCYEESVVPYQPFAEALRWYATSIPPTQLRDEVTRAGSIVARLAPGLERDLPALPEPVRAGPDTERHLLFQATIDLLAEIAARAPVLLVLDDLHWADEPTWLLLAHVARTTGPSRLLVVGTYRSSECNDGFDAIVANLRRDGLVAPVSLEGLDERGVHDLIVDSFELEAPASFCTAVFNHTDGNPFFVREVLHHVTETVMVNGEPGEFESIDWATLGVPQGVRDVISRRVKRLSLGAGSALTIASVIGREFTLDLLEMTTGATADELLDLLDEAVSAGVVAELPGATGRYSFSHALTRETLYGSLTRTRRARLHNGVGAALEAVHPDDRPVAVLAHHFVAGGRDAAKAARYCYLAGDAALQQLAHEEAAGHFQRGLAVLDSDVALRCDLLLGLAEAHRRAGRREEARKALEAAADHARRAGDAVRLAAVATHAHDYRSASPAQNEVEIGLLEEARAALPVGDSAELASVMGRLAVELYYTAERSRGVGLSELSVAMSRRLGDEETLVGALMCRHVAIHDPAHLDKRLAVADEAIEGARRLGDLETATLARFYRVTDLLEYGEVAAADAEMEAAERELAAIRAPLARLTPLYWHAMRAIMSGRLADGERLCIDAFQALHEAGYPDAFLILVTQLYQLRWLQGRLAELEPTLESLIAQYPALPADIARADAAPTATSAKVAGEVVATANAAGVREGAWRLALAHILCESGRVVEARQQFEIAAAEDFADLPFDNSWTTAMTVSAEVCAALGDVRRARRLYDLMSPYADQFTVLAAALTCSGAVARSLGQLATVLGRWSDAEAHFDSALLATRRAGAEPFVVLTLRDYARLLAARGDRGDADRAAALRSEIRSTAGALGMTALART